MCAKNSRAGVCKVEKRMDTPEVIIMKSRRERKSDSNTVKEAERSALKIAVTDPFRNR